LSSSLDEQPIETGARQGWRFERYATLGSTSDIARARALSGDSGRLWIVADAQSAGRGRQGRVWSSPVGNLYASALLVDPCATATAPQIGFVAGVALQRAVADLGVEARLKWPNDLVLDGAKLAGLLVEGVIPPGRPLAATIGIGVNIAASPEGLAYPTTSLSRAAGEPRSVWPLFERLLLRFDEALGQWARGEGFAAIRGAWLAAAANLGGPIRVANAHGAREGLFEGLDERGRLRLKRDGLVETIESADITLIATAASAPQGAAPRGP
jgi:BirA family transcriptional regulator, biotin operon repressor / biotin---[acetyl-CoA-carboxylase] ligase